MHVPADAALQFQALGVHQHIAGFHNLTVGCRRILRIKAGLLEHIDVVVQHGAGRVPREAPDILSNGVVVEHRLDDIVECGQLFFVRYRAHRLEHAAVERKLRTNLKNLHDVRRIALLSRQQRVIQVVTVAARHADFNLHVRVLGHVGIGHILHPTLTALITERMREDNGDFFLRNEGSRRDRQSDHHNQNDG